VVDPKARLKEYIDRSFRITKPEEKAVLASYLTGEAKTRLENWSPDQFRDAFMESKRELLSLSIREVKVVSDTEVQVTYELVYNQGKKGVVDHTIQAKVTNRKMCQMVRGEQGRWYIADVRNIKELIEFVDELSLP
jgi:hypothetical protein